MLKHFLRRDFDDLKLYWAVNLLVLLSIPVACHLTRDITVFIFLYFYVFMMLSMFPITHVLGSNWRNQHFLSRYYLLSLPVSHGELFIIQQIRILACWLSFIVFLFVLPVIILFFAKNKDTLMIYHISIYYIVLAVSIFYVVNLLMYSMLQTEKITSYKSKSERFWRHLSLLGIVIIGFGVLIIPWGLTFTGLAGQSSKLYEMDIYVSLISLGCMILMSALGLFFFFRNKSDWCVTFFKNKKSQL